MIVFSSIRPSQSLILVLLFLGCFQQTYASESADSCAVDRVDLCSRNSKWKNLILRGDSEVKLHNYELATKHFISAQQFCDSLPEQLNLIKTLDRIGYCYMHEKAYSKASHLFEESLNLKRRFYGNGSVQAIAAMNKLADCLCNFGKDVRAKQLKEEARLYSAVHKAANDRELNSIQNRLSEYYSRVGDTKMANEMKSLSNSHVTK